MVSFFSSNLTLRASRKLPYAVLPRVRSKKHYDFTLGRLAYASLRLVQDLILKTMRTGNPWRCIRVYFYIDIRNIFFAGLVFNARGFWGKA